MAQNIRKEAVAGQFYPADAVQLKQKVEACYKEANKIGDYSWQTGAASEKDTAVQAVIVPHAGYVFSGSVAASAFACIPEDAKYEHIFLIGPSHHVAFDGASVCNAFDEYRTPLGLIPVDRALCDSLINDNKCFTYRPSAHDKEHCLEVELPFLQYRLKNMPKIVPIIIGTQSLSTLKEIAAGLKPYFNSKNLFVISSDFSHYPSYEDALTVDCNSGEAVATGRLDKFIEALQENDSLRIRNLYTSACGQCAIAVLLLMARDANTGNLADGFAMHHIAYLNSGDSEYGGKDQVVGYHAFVLDFAKEERGERKEERDLDKEERGERKEERDLAQDNQERNLSTLSSDSFTLKTNSFTLKTDSFTLNDNDKQQLLNVAWNAISPARLHKKVTPTKVFDTKVGVFVTLTEHGRLRGCIGHFGEDIPLGKITDEMAHAAAFEDPRFMPLREEELKDIEIEISVLTPLKRIHNIDEFQYGKQGIYMRKGYHSGTFLPQVADEVNWTKDEFLGHCAQDKAGIGWDGWKTAELYTYEAIRFSTAKH